MALLGILPPFLYLYLLCDKYSCWSTWRQALWERESTLRGTREDRSTINIGCVQVQTQAAWMAGECFIHWAISLRQWTSAWFFLPGILPPNGQLVLAGDPKQLGAVVRSPIGIKCGLQKSLLERLMATKVYLPGIGKLGSGKWSIANVLMACFWKWGTMSNSYRRIYESRIKNAKLPNVHSGNRKSPC